MELNVRPALQLTQALLAGMRNARFGRIVNVSSLVTRGFPFRSSYAAAKSALESLTRTMAVELAPDGITANAVAPGPTETELFRENNPKGGEGEARYLAKVPMRRFASPEEIAAAIVFFRQRWCRIHHRPNAVCGWRVEPWHDLIPVRSETRGNYAKSNRSRDSWPAEPSDLGSRCLLFR
jgi:NAD(P)-dependent dehydrogenase (short-subunit alcohol dehydrogenase family)